MNPFDFINEERLTGVEAPNNRFSVRFHGHSYPLDTRKPKDKRKRVPPSLHKLPVATKAGSPEKSDLYRLFADSLQTIESMYDQVGAWLGSIFECNVEVRGAWLTQQRMASLMKQKSKDWEGFIPKFEFQRPVFDVAIDRRARFVVQAGLQQMLTDAVMEFAVKLLDALDLLVEIEHVGLINWETDSACKFHFFRHVLLEEQGGVRMLPSEVRQSVRRGALSDQHVTTTTERKEQDYSWTHRHARHVHEILDAKPVALPATNVSAPAAAISAMLSVFTPPSISRRMSRPVRCRAASTMRLTTRSLSSV